MPQTLSIRKFFANYYFSYVEDYFDFQFQCGIGFESELSAYAFLMRFSLDPSQFLFVKFRYQWYLVHMEGRRNQLIISNEGMWLRNDLDELVFASFRDMSKLSIRRRIPPELGSLTGGQTALNDAIVSDLEYLNKGQLEWICEPKLVKDTKKFQTTVNNCKVLLGYALSANEIPVYKLGVADGYFNVAPSSRNLWKEGVAAYDPFRNVKRVGEKAPYYLNDYVQALTMQGVKIAGQPAKSLATKSCPAWWRGTVEGE